MQKPQLISSCHLSILQLLADKFKNIVHGTDIDKTLAIVYKVLGVGQLYYKKNIPQSTFLSFFSA